VKEFAQAERRDEHGHQLEEHSYQLEAVASGKSRIPPFRLEMRDGRAAGSGPAAGSGAGSAATAKPHVD
jgi:hypothetical protein